MSAAWMFSAAGQHDTNAANAATAAATAATTAAAAAADLAAPSIPSLLELIQPHQVADLQRYRAVQPAYLGLPPSSITTHAAFCVQECSLCAGPPPHPPTKIYLRARTRACQPDLPLVTRPLAAATASANPFGSIMMLHLYSPSVFKLKQNSLIQRNEAGYVCSWVDNIVQEAVPNTQIECDQRELFDHILPAKGNHDAVTVSVLPAPPYPGTTFFPRKGRGKKRGKQNKKGVRCGGRGGAGRAGEVGLDAVSL